MIAKALLNLSNRQKMTRKIGKKKKGYNEMSHNIETMFSVREKPWHFSETKEVTKLIQEAPTSADALRYAGLDWHVEPKPIYTETNGLFGSAMTPIPGFVANTRDSDGAVLGVVTDAYKIVQNTDAFAFTDNIIGGDVRYETAGSLAGGKRIWLLARLPETEIVGDKVEQYLVFTNTFDGSGSVRVSCTPIRVVCQNTLNVALSTAKRSWSIRLKRTAALPGTAPVPDTSAHTGWAGACPAGPAGR